MNASLRSLVAAAPLPSSRIDPPLIRPIQRFRFVITKPAYHAIYARSADHESICPPLPAQPNSTIILNKASPLLEATAKKKKKKNKEEEAAAAKRDTDEKNWKDGGSDDVGVEGIDIDSVSESELRENGFRSTRRTKLVCTIGPACCKFHELEALANGGMNVARINMCHGSREWHMNVIRNVRKLNEEKGYAVAIMMDTEGSEIHMGDLGGASSAKAEVVINMLYYIMTYFLSLALITALITVVGTNQMQC